MKRVAIVHPSAKPADMRIGGPGQRSIDGDVGRRRIRTHVALGDHAIAIRGNGFDPGDAWNCRKPPGDASALR